MQNDGSPPSPLSELQILPEPHSPRGCAHQESSVWRSGHHDTHLAEESRNAYAFFRLIQAADGLVATLQTTGLPADQRRAAVRQALADVERAGNENVEATGGKDGLDLTWLGNRDAVAQHTKPRGQDD